MEYQSDQGRVVANPRVRLSEVVEHDARTIAATSGEDNGGAAAFNSDPDTVRSKEDKDSSNDEENAIGDVLEVEWSFGTSTSEVTDGRSSLRFKSRPELVRSRGREGREEREEKDC
jgi:hypothetical protein